MTYVTVKINKSQAEKFLEDFYSSLFDEIVYGKKSIWTQNKNKTPEKPLTKREQKLYDEMELKFVYDEK